MLVFTRKEGQRIMIGQDVEVVVVKTTPGHVKLGITAPPQVTIHRAKPGGRIPRGSPAEPAAPERSIPESSSGSQT